MDDLQFYILFNSISVISGRWEIDNERLCAMELCLWLRRFCPERGSNSVNWISRPALNPLSYWAPNVFGILDMSPMHFGADFIRFTCMKHEKEPYSICE